MSNGPLSERIENPEMCNLLLRLSHDALHVVVYSIVGDNSLVYRRFELVPTASKSWVGAIEDVIYDNPALLGDFRRVYCVVESDKYALVPSVCGSEVDRRLLFDAAFPASPLEMMADDTGTRNATVILGIEPELSGFISRTFQRATIVSHIASLCRYVALRTGQGNKPKMVANIRRTSLDIVVTDGGSLLMANTFAFRTPDDAVYYILAARKSLGLDPRADELILAGDQQTREVLTPRLRTYISRVMPMIFPPEMFKAGKDAMLAPFDLIITPICE